MTSPEPPPLHHHRENKHSGISPDHRIHYDADTIDHGHPGRWRTLTADPGAWSPAAALAYQSTRTAPQFPARPVHLLPGFGQRRHRRHHRRHRNQGRLTATAQTSAAVSLPTVASPTTPTPTVTGTPGVDKPLTADPGTGVLPRPWLIGRNATAPNFRRNRCPLPPGFGQHSASIAVSVTGTKAGYTSVTKSSTATAADHRRYACPGPGSDDLRDNQGRLHPHGQPRHLGPCPSRPDVPVVPLGTAITGATAPPTGSTARTQARPCPSGSPEPKPATPRSRNLHRNGHGHRGYPFLGPGPTISGTTRVGYTLTANPGTWGPAPVT